MQKKWSHIDPQLFSPLDEKEVSLKVNLEETVFKLWDFSRGVTFVPLVHVTDRRGQEEGQHVLQPSMPLRQEGRGAFGFLPLIRPAEAADQRFSVTVCLSSVSSSR